MSIIPTIEEFEAWAKQAGGVFFTFLLKIVIAVIAYLIVRAALKKFLKWLNGRMKKRGVDPSITSFVISLLKYGTLGFTIITIVVRLNIVEASSIAALLASAGIAGSLALQGGLSNFAGGLMLLILRPFHAGDYIIVTQASVEGTVQKIEMYYTTLTTIDMQTVLIPNSNLTNSEVINVSAQENRKLVIKIGISYDADLAKAKGVLTRLLDEDPRLQDEDRVVYVDSLGESVVTIAFRAWVKTEDYWQTYWDMNEKIKTTFDREGIEIAYPQIDVHIRGAQESSGAAK